LPQRYKKRNNFLTYVEQRFSEVSKQRFKGLKVEGSKKLNPKSQNSKSKSQG
jgi:hypothetical protein